MSYLAKALKHGRRPSNTAKDEEEKRLGSALSHYTNKSQCTYDSVFDKKIRELRPGWFENTADINKKKLLKLAKSSTKRPLNGGLDNALIRYTYESQAVYDLVFAEKIRKLRPDWFENTADINKKKLLELAKSGAKRPSSRAKDMRERKLGQALCYYTDSVFAEKIRKLRPDWFENTADKRKEKLLEIATIPGSKRPSKNSRDMRERKFGNSLSSYTNGSSDCYDPIFDKEIRKLRPDWFRRRHK